MNAEYDRICADLCARGEEHPEIVDLREPDDLVGRYLPCSVWYCVALANLPLLGQSVEVSARIP